jgi:hypothetical protein
LTDRGVWFIIFYACRMFLHSRLVSRLGIIESEIGISSCCIDGQQCCVWGVWEREC